MGLPKGPWTERWESKERLGKGGQGTTWVAERRSDQTKAVLKILNNNKSEQSRRRMFQEVANLRVLAQAGCKVPGILDENTGDFADSSKTLYVVMEYVGGDPLSEIVRTRNGIPLATAISLVQHLAVT